MAERRVSWIISANIQNWQKNLNQATRRMDRFGKDVRKVGNSFNKFLTAPMAAFGFTAIRTAGKFEESMNRVQAISQATESEMEQLSSVARELGATTAFSASEAADGMSFLAMAGLEVNEIVGSMPSVLNLAAAAKMDLSQAADIASNVMSGFGMTVDELEGAIDVMAKTMTSSNTDLSQLGEAMKMVAPVASSFGVQFEETSAAIGLLSDAGLQASQAGTGLRRIMTVLSQNAEDLGINVLDASGNMRPLADIIDDIQKQGMSASETMEVFGERAGPAMSVLLQRGSGELRNLTQELQNAGGTAQEVADKQMEGFNGMIKELQSAWAELQKTFMDGGAFEMVKDLLGDITEQVRSVTTWFKNLSDQAQRTFTQMALGLMTVGPALTAVGFAISGLAIAINALFSPITLTIGLIAGLSAAIWYVYENWDAVIERISDVGWWRNAIINMIQFWAEYNPFRFIADGYIKLLELLGIEVENPFVKVSRGLEHLKVETKEYENQMKSLPETVMDAIERWTGIDFGSFMVVSDSSIEEFQRQAFKKIGAYEWPDVPMDISPPDADMGKVTSAYGSATDFITKKLGDASDAHERLRNKSRDVSDELVNSITPMISGAISNMAESFLTNIAQMAAGSGNMTNIFRGVMHTLADLAIRVGKIAIGVAVAIDGIKKALQSLNPVAAFAAGAALIALGAATKAALSNVAEKSTQNSQASRSVNDALITSSGQVIEFNSADDILASKNMGKVIAGQGGSGGGNGGGRQYATVNVNIDGRRVDQTLTELKFRKSR